MATPNQFGSLAFVDVETTGLSPAANRIAEIGVVTVDDDRADRWSTLLKTSSRREYVSHECRESQCLEEPPSFSDIANDLAQRLSGRLMVAHNARFDHAFLRAEFDRIGVMFNPSVLCSVMLSRKLYPHLAHHDLDSLIECHGLRAAERHRALPDADLLWQWWEAIHRQCPGHVIDGTIERLLAGPVLPPQLDMALIERLPESPGAYVLHGEGDEPLAVGAAANLKLQIVNYFRLDKATAKALEFAHRITNITWRATRGLLGAQLHAAALDADLFATAKRKMSSAAFTWQLAPSAVPCVAVVPLADLRGSTTTESFGIFGSRRKARNALIRFATTHRLCHCVLGIGDSAYGDCLACPVDQPPGACVGMMNRKKQLVRVFGAMKPLRIAAWPHQGAVGIRERSDIHVVDDWQFFGTARNEADLYALLENRKGAFDKRLYRLLNRTLSRLPPTKIVALSRYCQPDRAADRLEAVDR